MILDSFVKQTAGGQLLTVVKEHYLRDDIEYVSLCMDYCAHTCNCGHSSPDYFEFAGLDVPWTQLARNQRIMC